MKRISLLAACVLFVACGRAGGGFDDGVPSAEAVKLELPGDSGQALRNDDVGQQRQGLGQGKISDFYQLTRGVTLGVNVGVGAVLGLVKAITNHPPTSTAANTAIWGPHTEDLSPNTWKLTVTRMSNDEYEYALEGKPKTEPDSAYVVVLSGTHSPSGVEGFGKGSFTLDWDNAQKLPEHDANVGKAQVTYERADTTSNVIIDVSFVQVRDAKTGGLKDVEYRYQKKPQQGGFFEFSTDEDIGDAGSKIEHLTIKSRWTNVGAGRSDVRVTGGDLAGQATMSECWDSNFLSQYLATSFAPLSSELNYGVEANACSDFPAAEFSNL